MSDKDITTDQVAPFVDAFNKDSAPDESLHRSVETLIEQMPDFSPLWEAILANDLGKQEIDIRISFPLKQVSTFVVVKQLTFSWKIGDSYSPWKLHVQLLATTKSSDKKDGSEINSRVIWSKEGRYYHKMSSFLKPNMMEMVCKLSPLFGFASKVVDELTFPFV